MSRHLLVLVGVRVLNPLTGGRRYQAGRRPREDIPQALRALANRLIGIVHVLLRRPSERLHAVEISASSWAPEERVNWRREDGHQLV
jgi:hypothetical protein